jgi:hypothetical protein
MLAEQLPWRQCYLPRQPLNQYPPFFINTRSPPKDASPTTKNGQKKTNSPPNITAPHAFPGTFINHYTRLYA